MTYDFGLCIFVTSVKLLLNTKKEAEHLRIRFLFCLDQNEHGGWKNQTNIAFQLNANIIIENNVVASKHWVKNTL